VRYLPDKKIASLSHFRFCADRAHNLPGPAANNVPRVPQISSKSVHLRRCCSRTREHRSNARIKWIQYSAKLLASRRVIMQATCGRMKEWGKEAARYCSRYQVTVDEDMKPKVSEILTDKCRDECLFCITVIGLHLCGRTDNRQQQSKAARLGHVDSTDVHVHATDHVSLLAQLLNIHTGQHQLIGLSSVTTC